MLKLTKEEKIKQEGDYKRELVKKLQQGNTMGVNQFTALQDIYSAKKQGLRYNPRVQGFTTPFSMELLRRGATYSTIYKRLHIDLTEDIQETIYTECFSKLSPIISKYPTLKDEIANYMAKVLDIPVIEGKTRLGLKEELVKYYFLQNFICLVEIEDVVNKAVYVGSTNLQMLTGVGYLKKKRGKTIEDTYTDLQKQRLQVTSKTFLQRGNVTFYKLKSYEFKQIAPTTITAVKLLLSKNVRVTPIVLLSEYYNTLQYMLLNQAVKIEYKDDNNSKRTTNTTLNYELLKRVTNEDIAVKMLNLSKMDMLTCSYSLPCTQVQAEVYNKEDYVEHIRLTQIQSITPLVALPENTLQGVYIQKVIPLFIDYIQARYMNNKIVLLTIYKLLCSVGGIREGNIENATTLEIIKIMQKIITTKQSLPKQEKLQFIVQLHIMMVQNNTIFIDYMSKVKTPLR